MKQYKSRKNDNLLIWSYNYVIFHGMKVFTFIYFLCELPGVRNYILSSLILFSSRERKNCIHVPGSFKCLIRCEVNCHITATLSSVWNHGYNYQDILHYAVSRDNAIITEIYYIMLYIGTIL